MNIQHYSLHDGPGIRTTVFLKGCSLRCKWCCNPESILPKQELAYNSKDCIGVAECGACLRVCQTSALYKTDRDPKALLDWNLCVHCGECVSKCPSGALHIFGQVMTVDQVLKDVEEDDAFYGNFEGGIALSGGECLLQPEFSAALLSEAHRRGISTSIETSGNVPWESMEMVLAHVDTIYHDLKLMDPAGHKKWTGADNALILANLKRAYQAFPEKAFFARSPIIPGVNDTEEHIRAVLSFILPYRNVTGYELLPYHRFGMSKYNYLGKVYELRDFLTPSAETMQKLKSIVDEAFSNRASQKKQIE